MDAATATQLAAVVGVVGKIFESLGPAGVIGLVLGGPLIMLFAIVVITGLNSRQQAALLEAYRTDTQTILRECNKAFCDTTQYYRDNVNLVKGYQTIADTLQTLVVTNTKAMENATRNSEEILRRMSQ